MEQGELAGGRRAEDHKSRRSVTPAPGGEEGINTVTRQRTEEVVILKRGPCPDSLPAMPSPPKSIRASKLQPTLWSEATVRPMPPLVSRIAVRRSGGACSPSRPLPMAAEMRETTALGQEKRGAFLPPTPFRAGKVFPVNLCALTSDSAAPGEKVWDQNLLLISVAGLATMLPHDTVASRNCVG